MGELYDLLQSIKSSSSGTGGSYYGVAATCGMKSHLQETFPYEEPEHDGAEISSSGRRKVNARRCGVFYHKLQEMWRTGAIPERLAVLADHSDYDFELALNSFCRYREYFRNDPHNLGRVKSVELKLPATPEQEQLILEFTGGIPFTMRYDLLTTVGMIARANIAIERGLAISASGDYLVDYKLVGSISPMTMWQYSFEFQQMAYPVIYNVCNPSAPVQGMLTDVMARVQQPEPRHYGLYLAYPDENAQALVRDGIQFAHAARLKGAANPFACLGKYGPCYFLTSGICPRHGSFADFDFSNGKATPCRT